MSLAIGRLALGLRSRNRLPGHKPKTLRAELKAAREAAQEAAQEAAVKMKSAPPVPAPAEEVTEDLHVADVVSHLDEHAHPEAPHKRAPRKKAPSKKKAKK